MDLSRNVIKRFVEVTSDVKVTPNDTTVYGTIVNEGDSLYVKIDGSEVLTPVSSTIDIREGDRVLVLIKNHEATVIGSPTSPTARLEELRALGENITEFGVIIADKVGTGELVAMQALIEELQAKDVEISGKLTANDAKIEELSAENVEITGKFEAYDANIEQLTADNVNINEELNAVKANIEDLDVSVLEADLASFKTATAENFTADRADIAKLKTDKLSAEDADLKYANIDFSNISKATMEEFYANSGLIDNVVIGDATISGELVGVTIKGDLIEGGTVKADKLVILGDDGLYYKLNTNGVTTQAEQTEYNSLNGSVITAKSITAEKVKVEDLVAFGATIGGFHIASNSLYSGVKESVANTTRGVYLDSNGQVAFGDADNYIKFYEDEEGVYKLDISAAGLYFGSEKKSVEIAFGDVNTDILGVESGAQTGIEDVGNRVAEAFSEIKKLNDSISTLVVDSDGQSLMKQSGDGWVFSVESIDEALDSTAEALNSLKSSIGDWDLNGTIVSNINALLSVVGDHGDTLNWVTIGEIDADGDGVAEPCIELGESDSVYKLVITNKAIYFREGSATPTRIQDNTLVTNNVEIKNELRQTNPNVSGYWMWSVRSNGNYGLTWKGA